MIQDVSRYTSVLVRLKITPSQFLFMYLTHLQNFPDVYRYVEEGQGFSEAEIKDLEDRGFIMNFNPSGQFYVDNFVVQDKFLSEVFTHDAHEASRQFWDAYPDHITIDGKKVPTKAVSQEKLFREYYHRVGHNATVHELNMAAIAWAKQHNKINMGIAKWFDSRQWEVIQREMAAKPTRASDLPANRIL